MSINSMTTGPEFGSVAPLARIPPTFSIPTQMNANVTMATPKTTCVTLGCQ